ncbi:putative 5-formyltetrahydrofolate cyclo-ligase [Psilocybe cubensis]|uniref:5-formyltetrahydrofolate cyclo-ligase n=1 Tax=Psilocybe cubensis TaxID=181762 RepID=A0ACB8GS55_PSICU|nr:putative 5-formyltetrahydrofolate cyclo-ligase [Psilocybe cubensis]KAH9478563.1 putative 5-formyltetrahydrofolate cyclo-ligase [Psilocybe cubensis]
MPTGEVRTAPIVNAILHAGKMLFVPKILTKDGTMDFFRIYSSADLASLPSGTWGIKEPGESLEGGQTRSRGVAFDRTLSRLGHGKGYYDRFITAYNSAFAYSPSSTSVTSVSSNHRKPLLVGLGLREQLLPGGEVPIGEHDWKMDVIITPDETITSDSAEKASIATKA